MKTQQKVYEFVEEQNEKLVDIDEMYLTVNNKLLQIGGEPVKAESIFVKMNTVTGMVIGYSPLETLELTDDGLFIANRNKVGFVGKDGEAIRIARVRNKLIQWNDKDTTEEIDTLFNMLLDKKNDVKSENKLIAKLENAEYVAIENEPYTFMVKDGEPPYLFMETNEELTLLDIDEVYSNEDSKKFSILNQDKHLYFDIINNKIEVKA